MAAKKRSRRRDPGKVIHVNFQRHQPRTSVPSQSEYENREHLEFMRQIRQAENGALAERKESARAFFHVLKTDPALVAERVGWLLNGSYGYGSHKAAQGIIRRPRMNAGAWLTTTVAALEWMCPQRMAIAAWKKLTVAEQERLRVLIQMEINQALVE